jgi:type I restriction enzyme S subunit
MSDLPKNWKLSTIGNACEIVKGKKPKNSGERSDQRMIPYINIRAFESGLAEQFAEPGEYPTCNEEDVLIVWDGARSGLIGRGVSGYIGSTLARISCESLGNSFLFYFLQSKYGDINSRTKGVGIPHVDPQVFNTIEIPLPPLPEQRRIVVEIEKQFTRLEAGVAALRRVKANLKRYRAAVLKAACEGKLVPTEAELHKSGSGVPPLVSNSKEKRGKRQDAASTSTFETGEQLLQRILSERRKRWNESNPQSEIRNRKYKEPAAPDTTNLPPLPDGWTWASLEQISRESSYGTSAKCNYNNSGPPVLRIPNIAAGRIDISDLKFAGITEHIKVGDELAPGDLLIIRTNGSKSLIGRSAIILENLARPTIYASYLIRFRLVAESTLFTWVGTVWDVSFLRAWIEQRAATSAGQHNISMSVLSALPIPLPPLSEQTRIVAEVERRLSVVEELEAVVSANLQRAIRLRQSILHRAFTGTIK